MPRPSVSVKTFVKMYFCLYERRASPPCLDLAIEILPRRAGNFPYNYTVNTLKRAGPPRRTSKSKLCRDNKVCLGQYFFGYITLHSTSSACLCVQSDSGFCGNINVDSPGDLAKQASPRYVNSR